MTLKGDASCQEFSREQEQLKFLYPTCQSLGLEEGWENVYDMLLLNASEGYNWGYPWQLDLLLFLLLFCANRQGHNRQDRSCDTVLQLKISIFFFSDCIFYLSLLWTCWYLMKEKFLNILFIFQIGSHKRCMSQFQLSKNLTDRVDPGRPRVNLKCKIPNNRWFHLEYVL